MVLKILKLFVKNKPFSFDWDIYMRNLINKYYIISCSKCHYIYHYPYNGKKKIYACPNCKTNNTIEHINITKIAHELLEKAIYTLKLQFYNGISLKILKKNREILLQQIDNSPYISPILKKRLKESIEEETVFKNWKKKSIKENLKEYLDAYNRHHKYL